MTLMAYLMHQNCVDLDYNNSYLMKQPCKRERVKPRRPGFKKNQCVEDRDAVLSMEFSYFKYFSILKAS